MPTSTAISAQGSTVEIENNVGAAIDITSITKAGSAVVGLEDITGILPGEVLSFSGVVGMTEINGMKGIVKTVTPGVAPAGTVTVFIDSSDFTTYTSGGTATPRAWQRIKNLKSFRGMDGSSTELDVTNLDSEAKEFILGLSDEGTFSFDIDYDPSSGTGHQLLRNLQSNGFRRAARLTLPDATVAVFDQRIKKFDVAGGVDQVLRRNVELRITGPVTWVYTA